MQCYHLPLASTTYPPPGLALVLDLDGVIVHSNPVHSTTWREYLKLHGIDPPGDFEARMYGKRNDDIVRAVFGSALDEAAVLRHGVEKEKLYRQRMRGVLDACLVPGLRGFLERRRAWPMAVATNGERPNLDFVLDSAGLRRYFRATLDGNQVSQPKPSPEIYLRVAVLLQVRPQDCIVFEDSYTGVEAARAAGARVVGVRTTHPDLPGVDLSIPDFLDAELESWLVEQRPAA